MTQNAQQRVSTFGRGQSFQNLTVTSSPVSLTVPAGAKSALCSVDNVTVRWRVDGSAPTTVVGHQLPLDTYIEFFGDDMEYVQFISTGASTNLFVTYYQ